MQLDGTFVFVPSKYDIEVIYEKAFSEWRHTVMRVHRSGVPRFLGGSSSAQDAAEPGPMGSGTEPEGVGEAEVAESDSESGAEGREEPRWDRQTPDEDTFCPF